MNALPLIFQAAVTGILVYLLYYNSRVNRKQVSKHQEEVSRLQWEKHQMEREYHSLLQKYEPQLQNLRYIRKRHNDDSSLQAKKVYQATQATYRFLESQKIEYHQVFASAFTYKVSPIDRSMNTRGVDGVARMCTVMSKEAFRKRIKEPYLHLFYYCSLVEYGELKIWCHFEELAA